MRQVKKVIIGLIIILLFSLISMKTVFGYWWYNPEDGKNYENLNPNVIIGYGNKAYDLSKDEGKVITLKQYLNEKSGIYVSILHQPNVFCMEPSADLDYAQYIPSQAYTVTDPVLHKILKDGTNMNSLEPGAHGWKVDHQRALWCYLSDSDDNHSSADKNRLRKNLNFNWGAYGAYGGTDTYNNAVNTCQNASNPNRTASVSIDKFKVSNNNNNVTIQFKLSGVYDSLKFTLSSSGSSKTITPTYNSNTKWYTYTGELIGNTKYTFKVEAKVNRVPGGLMKYRILQEATGYGNSQKLLVSIPTDLPESTDSDERDIQTDLTELDISLQKYIYAAGSKFDEIGDTGKFANNSEMRKEEGTLRGDKNATKNSERKIALNKSVSSTDNWYKQSNPIQIALNDYVVYKVNVYNNGDKDFGANGVYVRDRIDKNVALVGIYKSYSNGIYSDEMTKVSKGNLSTTNQYEIEKTDSKYNYFRWYSGNISKASGGNYKAKSFYIVFRYENYIQGVINNKAYLLYSRNTTDFRTTDYDYVTMETDVSLQKFIVSVGTGIDSSDQTSTKLKVDTRDGGVEYNTSRISRKATSKSGNNIFNQNNKAKTEKNFPNTSAGGEDIYKYNNPQEILHINHIVAYRIDVYNNKSTPATVNVKDRIDKSKGAIFKGIFTGRGDSFTYTGKLKKDTGGEFEVGEYKATTTNENYNYYDWKVTLAGNSYKTYWILVQYGGDNYLAGQIINNKAYINDNYNNSDYQTEDYDYIVVYSNASIQKYVVNAGKTFTRTNANKENETAKLTNSSYGYNESNRWLRKATSESKELVFNDENNAFANKYRNNIANDNYKINDPVPISKNDYVVYRIDIYNNYTATDIKVNVRERIENKYGSLVGVYRTYSNNTYSDPIKVIDGGTSDDDVYKYFNWDYTLNEKEYKAFWVVVKYDGDSFSAGHKIGNRAYFLDTYNKEEPYLTMDYDYVVLKADVSLQKYVAAVGKTFSKNNTAKTGQFTNTLTYGYSLDRRGKMAKSDTNKNIFKSGVINTAANGYVPTVEGDNLKEENYKINTPVPIDKNDYVVYKVDVYNNKNIKTAIDVRERIENIGNLVEIYSDYNKDTGVYSKPIGEHIETKNGYKYYKWEYSIDANAYKSFWVVVRYNGDVTAGKLITNKASVNNTAYFGNDTTYRIEDYDYVAVRSYISLEKYVVSAGSTFNKVSSNSVNRTIGGNISYGYENFARQGKIADASHVDKVNIYDKNKNNADDKGYSDIVPTLDRVTEKYKVNTPVGINKGDYVVYKVVVYNNGDLAASVNVRERVQDNITDLNNIWVYKDRDGNTYSDPVTIINDGGTKDGWQFFNWDYTIGANSYKAFWVIVKYDGDAFTAGEVITNRAHINNVSSNSGSSSYRTMDFDYVIMKTNLSLQKYVVNAGKGFDSNTGELKTSNPTYDYSVGRQGRKAISDTAARIFKDGNKINEGDGFDYAHTVVGDNLNQENYKSNKPVKIKKGDFVVYRIDVYNNLSTKSKIVVKDKIEEAAGSLIGVYKGHTNNSETVQYDKYASKVDTENKGLTDEGKYRLHIWETTVEGNDFVPFWVVVRYNKSGVSDGQKIQNIAYINATTNETTYRNTDRDYVQTLKYSVGIEKYVTKANDSTTLNPSANREGHPIYYQNNFSKETNPVVVDWGKEVEYTIKITNTGANTTEYGTIKNIEIEDITPDGLTYKGCRDVTKNSNGTFTYSGAIGVGDSATFTLIYSMKNDVEQATKIQNTATFKSMQNDEGESVVDSDGVNNNTDKDWIRTKSTAVALQKYITEVQSLDGTVTYDDRVDHRYNPNDGVSDTYRDSHKRNNKVKVEPGDIVTFTIKLQNTGELPVKISQIYDTYSWYTREGMRETGLEYVQNSITGNGNSYDFTFGYNDENDKYDYYDKYLIEFKNPETIQPGSEKVVTIQFRVTSTIAGELEIWNKAGIVQIIDYRDNVKNLDFMKVEPQKDFDGPDNNYDTDFMMIQEYKVSLEKFITSVTDKDGGNKVDCTDRTGENEEDAKNTYRFNEDPLGDDGSSVLNSNTGELKSGSTEVENLHFYKHNNAVRAEAGDKVTYTIRLRNTGTTKVKVTKIYDSFRFDESTNATYKGIKLVYDETFGIQGNGGGTIINNHYGNDAENDNKRVDKYLIEFNTPELIDPGEYTDVTIQFSVELENPELTKREIVISNKAVIVSLKNKNNVTVYDADGDVNNKDMDFIRTKIYKLSLQKIVYSVDGKTNGISSFDRWTSWESTKINNQNKHNNPVTVSNGDKIIYAIKVKNDGETIANNINVQDNLPNGLDLSSVKIDSITSSNNTETGYTNYARENNKITFTLNKPLSSGEENIIYVSATVTEPNISLSVLKNTAEIIGTMTNRNDRTVMDSTTTDNNDADYIQMRDITISGRVWNDKPSNKAQDHYNGLYKDEDTKLEGITVKLYRQGVETPLKTTTTDTNGIYTFTSADIDPQVITHQCERYIKGPYKCKDSTYSANNNHTANYWAGTYYSYYVVFEYDGIRYTSTKITDTSNQLGVYNTTYNDSNAKEDNQNGRITGITGRDEFNNRFDKINNQSGINYATVNKDDYIPQSLHQYDPTKMAMHSSTNRIELTNNATREEQLQHINLGLRGKDIFDLELTSDVDNIKITVNGQLGEYKYGNKVKLRQEDLTPTTKKVEDMANILSEESNLYVDTLHQKIRNSDLKPQDYGYEEDQGISKIEVTYKIVVQNTSPTAGKATKIVNYYDSRYSINSDKGKVAYYYRTNADKENDNKTWIAANKIANGDTESKFKSIIITTQATKLEQADKMEIYVVYTLNEPKTTLADLTSGTYSISTYNMAEIFEYQTECGEGQNKYTRGLIDKDSAPGNANTLRATLKGGVSDSKTTVQYYFDAGELDKLNILKYEDDTYATPTLYFASTGENPRTIEGIVFEDKTKINSLKIKTGNGIRDAGEVGVYEVTVQLIELQEETRNEEALNTGKQIELNSKYYPVRDTQYTDKEGNFRFEGFLPGNYIIRYRYGDREKAVIQNMAEEGINGKSYNGEDFQATNNYQDVAELETNKLNTTENFWYIYNENQGISTAFDNLTRRLAVSNNVTNFIDEQMTVLNNMRDGKPANDAKVIYNDGGVDRTITVQNIIDSTKMYADTEKILITVEKTEKDGSNLVQKTRFDKYEIRNMNFGIAEVPVTTIDLQKHVDSFKITDASGKNVIASMKKVGGNWEMEGDVIDLESIIDISIEDEKLQGSRLEITFAITVDMDTEINFDGKENVLPTITGLADFVNNNLSYNPDLGDNSRYWEVTTHEYLKTEFEKMKYKADGSIPKGTVDPDGTIYTTVVKAKSNNPLLLTTAGNGAATITLEKILSSTDATLEEIITSTVDISEYDNTVEITGFDYSNTTPGAPGAPGGDPDPDPEDIMRDRVRNKARYIILPGVQYDFAASEIVTIHPPTGDSGIAIIYYIMAVVALAVFAIGVYGVKKIVVKK